VASLQAKHGRSCALGRAWTSFAAAVDGCSCPTGPLYYVVIREGGRADKVRAGRNRRQAERALRKLAVAVDEGEYEPQLNVSFDEWADRWLESLERKATTVRSYRPTMTYAKVVFAHKAVRRLRADDIAAFNRMLRERGISASTRAKHLRVLGACLQSAVRHGYAGRNPARDLPPAERPRPDRKEAAYFENDEVPRLFAELPDGPVKTLFLLALKTGMRQGELIGLRWGDIDLGAAVVRVRRSYTDGAVSTPKNHERRDVDLRTTSSSFLGGGGASADGRRTLLRSSSPARAAADPGRASACRLSAGRVGDSACTAERRGTGRHRLTGRTPSQAEGRGFEPRRPLKRKPRKRGFLVARLAAAGPSSY